MKFLNNWYLIRLSNDLIIIFTHPTGYSLWTRIENICHRYPADETGTSEEIGHRIYHKREGNLYIMLTIPIGWLKSMLCASGKLNYRPHTAKIYPWSKRSITYLWPWKWTFWIGRSSENSIYYYLFLRSRYKNCYNHFLHMSSQICESGLIFILLLMLSDSMIIRHECYYYIYKN